MLSLTFGVLFLPDCSWWSLVVTFLLSGMFDGPRMASILRRYVTICTEQECNKVCGPPGQVTSEASLRAAEANRPVCEFLPQLLVLLITPSGAQLEVRGDTKINAELLGVVLEGQTPMTDHQDRGNPRIARAPQSSARTGSRSTHLRGLHLYLSGPERGGRLVAPV